MWKLMQDTIIIQASGGMGHSMRWGSADYDDTIVASNNSILPEIALYLLFLLLVILALVIINRKLKLFGYTKAGHVSKNIKCGNCGLQISEEFKFCPGCSSSLQQECSNCHRKVHVSWKCCPYCASEVEK